MSVFSKVKNFVLRKLHESYTLKSVFRKFGMEWPLYPSGHYYSPIVSTKDVLHKKELFQHHSTFLDIELNKGDQKILLDSFAKIYHQIPFTKESNSKLLYFYDNPFFSYSDSIFLFSSIAHFKPTKIIEIGSGFSTACMLDTIDTLNLQAQVIAIDPDMSRLNNLVANKNKSYNYLSSISKKVQTVDKQLFKELNENDILFIDSSHISKIGSELNFLLFEILPILKSGVIIHFHDVFHNFEYPKEWIDEGISFNEQYLLRAFLQNNEAYEVLLFNAYLEIEFKDWFSQNMPLCLNPHERYTFGKNKNEFIPHIKGQSLYLQKK